MTHTPGKTLGGLKQFLKDGEQFHKDRFDHIDAKRRLCNAAPELLEAIKALADAVSNGSTTVATLDAVGKARAAIAKAEGKQ